MDIEEEDREFDEDMLLRESKLRFPDVEEWILKMAIKAHLNLGGEKFVSDLVKGEEIKKTYFQGNEYVTEF